MHPPPSLPVSPGSSFSMFALLLLSIIMDVLTLPFHDCKREITSKGLTSCNWGDDSNILRSELFIYGLKKQLCVYKQKNK